MFYHVWNVQGALEAVEHGFFVSVDFSKAYDSVSHNSLVAFFLYIALPAPLVSLLMSMFQAPLIFLGGMRGRA